MNREKLTVLVTGSNGQLGKSIKRYINNFGTGRNEWIFTGKDEIDITDKSAVQNFIKNRNIDVVVNCAAFTNVDECQDKEIGIGKAYDINVKGPFNIANALNQTNGVLIQISTDYVFDGTSGKPYTEDDEMSPINRYGLHKLYAENMICWSKCNSVIIRTGWLYSEYGKNFLLTMLDKLRNDEYIMVVDDQIGTPTYAYDLAAFIVTAINNRIPGFIPPDRETGSINLVYNFSDLGAASWYDFSMAIREYGHFTESSITQCESDQFNTKADRPHFSVLSKRKILNERWFSIPYWRNSLKKCIENIAAIESAKNNTSDDTI